MARVERDQPLIPSVLDRLIDENPEETREPTKARNQLIGELRQSIRRDLENLLNTHWRCRSWPVEFAELSCSVVGYGIPDVSGSDLVSERGRSRFLKTVEETIRAFEPRFKSVRVAFAETGETISRELRFRIDAMMYAFPAPEPIVFDTSLEPSTGEFSVKGSNR